MKKLAVSLSLASLSLMAVACQQTAPTATTPSPPETTAITTPEPVATETPTTPTNGITAFAGKYSGTYSDKKKADWKTQNITNIDTVLSLTADGKFEMTLTAIGLNPETQKEETKAFKALGSFTVDEKGEQVSLALEKSFIDGQEVTPQDPKPLVLKVSDGGKTLAVTTDTGEPITPDTFTKK